MKRFHSNVSSAKAALQERPEVLKAIRVDAALYIGFGMIHYVMHKAIVQKIVTDRVIGINRGTILDVAQDGILQSLALYIWNNVSANLPRLTIKDSLHGSLAAVESALLVEPSLTLFVHVLSESTDEGFVGLKFRVRPTHLPRKTERTVVQGFAEPLKHEPCRLLRNSDRAVNLHAGHTVLAVNKHPERRHPLVHANRGILKNSVHFDGELLVTSPAKPDAASLDKVVFVGATARTRNLAIRPPKANGIVKGPLRITEVNDGFLKGARCFHG